MLPSCPQLRTALAIAALIAGVVTTTPRALQVPTPAIEDPGVTILVYHRFGPTVQDSMTVRTATFRWQLDYLKRHHHPIIPLRTLISYLRG
jgi:hypothetical protein